MKKLEAQHDYDASRSTYRIIYARGTTELSPQAFLRSIGSDLIPNSGDRGSIPTIVPEIRWTDTGIHHYIRMTPQDESHVLSMLEAQLPAVTIDPVDSKDSSLDINPIFAIDVLMSDPSRNLRIESIKDFAVALLHSVPSVGENEIVTYQLIASHTDNIKVPGEHASKSKASWLDILMGKVEAPKEEIVDRRTKVNEQNFNVTIRISAQAATEERGRSLVGGVLRSLRSAESNYVKLTGRPIAAKHRKDVIKYALTPRKKTAQLSVSEFAAFLGLPIGDPAVPGLPQGSAKRIAPTEAVPREGRLLGHSNLPKMRNRPVALGYDFTDRNMIYIGGIGSGKSVGMANNAYDDMMRGMGVFVIDSSAGDSAQTLYNRVLGYVPAHRVDDVINNHVRAGAEFPIAFELFKQGLGTEAIDEITAIFIELYPDTGSGVTVRELLHHALWTLMDADLNFVDIDPLLNPKNDNERSWAQQIVKNIKDQELHDFWDRMKDTGWCAPAKDSSKNMKWSNYIGPLYRRLWQLVGRPEIRHMIGQSVNEGEGLNWDTAVRDNKIVLVSLAGLPRESAQILGSLMTRLLWKVVQKYELESPEIHTPGAILKNQNALYLDEFQVSAPIKDQLREMTALGRKHGLNITLGTQYLSELKNLQSAVTSNVWTRVIYPVKSADEAAFWRRNIMSDKLSDFDFMNGKPYEPIVQLPTSAGDQVLTIHALNERAKTGNSHQVVALSRKRYGRHVDQVRREIQQRRRVAKSATAAPAAADKSVGETPFDWTD